MFKGFAVAGVAALMVSVSPLTMPSSGAAFAQETTVNVQQDGKVTLVEITTETERLVAALVRASRLSSEDALNISSDTGKPYWAALRALNTAVGKMTNGATLQDKSFHTGLSETIREGAALLAAYELSGADDAKVVKVTEALEKNLTVIHDAFSKAASRAQKGGELSEAEKARLEQIKAKQTELQRRLDAMESKVKDNKRALAGLKEVRRRSENISTSGSTVGSFLAAMIAFNILDGLIWGCLPWWGPWGGWYSSFSVVFVDIYDGYYDDLDYDWDVYGEIEVDYDLALADEDLFLDDAGVVDSLDYIDDVDVDIESGLSDAALEGVAVPTAEDFENEDFELDASLNDDLGDLGDGDALDSLSDEALTPEVTDDLADEMTPLVEDAAPIASDILDDPAPMLEDAAPLDLGGDFDDFDGGFDSFDGGGFDDFGGGFDDW